MKQKLLAAGLLFCCFCWLAVLTGTLPVLTPAGAISAEWLPSPEPSPSPTQTPEPAESSSPSPTETFIPSEIIEESPTPIEEPDDRLIPTTITGPSLLDNDTDYGLDEEELLAEGVRLPLPSEGAQILIVHTHTTEAYRSTAEDPYDDEGDCRTTDPAHNVVRVGDALAEALARYGLRVVHDTTIHDDPSYSGSYARSGETVEARLAEEPGIALVIDLHRDALGDGDVTYKTLADIDGVEAAQLMFVMGSDVNLDHPNWRENLRLALTLHRAVAERYPTLMRPTVLCDYRYNQQLSPGALLLEVGTSGNTMAEAIEGVERFAEVVGPILASWAE